MIVHVRLFAAAREIAGSDRLEIELDGDATVGQLRQRLAEAHPDLADLLRHAMFAVDQQYVVDTTRLRDGCEVAMIPPVSGG